MSKKKSKDKEPSEATVKPEFREFTLSITFRSRNVEAFKSKINELKDKGLEFKLHASMQSLIINEFKFGPDSEAAINSCSFKENKDD